MAFVHTKACEGMRNERLLFSVICSNVVSDHNKSFGLVLMAYLEREVFSTLDAGILPIGLPGPTHNLLGLFQIE